jgi:hypothetical protein
LLLLTAGGESLHRLQSCLFFQQSKLHISVDIVPDFGSQPAPGQAAAVLNACRVDADQPKQQQLQQQLVVELAAANSRR